MPTDRDSPWSRLRLRRLLPCALVLAAGAACGLAPAGPTKIRVNAETLPWADMSGYRTYRWWKLPLNQGVGYSEREALLDWRVRSAVERGKRGLRPRIGPSGEEFGPGGARVGGDEGLGEDDELGAAPLRLGGQGGELVGSGRDRDACRRVPRVVAVV